MAYDLEEQEQIDAIKAWWKRVRQSRRCSRRRRRCSRSRRSRAGATTSTPRPPRRLTLYEQLEQARARRRAKKVRDIAAQIIDSYGSTPYAVMAALAARRPASRPAISTARKKHLQVGDGQRAATTRCATSRGCGSPACCSTRRSYDEALKLARREAEREPRRALRRSQGRHSGGAGQDGGSAQRLPARARQERRRQHATGAIDRS